MRQECLVSLCSLDGSIIATDQTNRQVIAYDVITHKTRVFAGSGRKETADGETVNADFSQPFGICVEFESVFVTDPSSGQVRMINCDMKGTATFLQNLGRLLDVFGIKLKGKSPRHLTSEECMELLTSVSR